MRESLTRSVASQGAIEAEIRRNVNLREVLDYRLEALTPGNTKSDVVMSEKMDIHDTSSGGLLPTPRYMLYLYNAIKKEGFTNQRYRISSYRIQAAETEVN
ncbi:uncharacterized protein LOC144363066 [Saccoglossus kowalevskii]